MKTSKVLASQPLLSTMAHSYVQAEYEAIEI